MHIVTVCKYERGLILAKTEITAKQCCEQLPNVLSHRKKRLVLWFYS